MRVSHTARSLLTPLGALEVAADPQRAQVLTHGLLRGKLGSGANIETPPRGHKGFINEPMDRSLEVADLLFPDVGIVLREVLVSHASPGHVTQVDALLSTLGVLVGDQGVSTQTGVLLTCYQCDIWTSVDHGGDLFTRFPTKSVCIIFHIPNCLCVTLSHNQR